MKPAAGWRMRHARPVAVLIALLSSSSLAHADGGYAGGGIGPGAGLAGEISTAFRSDESMNARVSIGQRVGPVALEASLFGAGLVGRGDFAGRGTEYDTVSLGVDLKYFFGLVGPLEFYPKLGLNKTWLTGGRDGLDYDGIGWDLGLGLQYNFERVGV